MKIIILILRNGLSLFFLLLLLQNHAYSQGTVLTAGKSDQNATGSMTQSIGQPFYTPIGNQGKSVSVGVQQAYAIEEMVTSNAPRKEIRMTIFPNPVNNELNLDFDQSEVSELTYNLTTLDGKLLKSGSLEQNTHSISFKELPAGLYILKIISAEELLKTFKIVKK